MRILRIYNNNVVLASTDAGDEAVMIGRGLGFGKKKGQRLDPEKVEQTFVPEGAGGPDQIGALLSELPPGILTLATELEQQARAEFGRDLPHSFVLPLADHLNFAVVRARDGMHIEYPLAIEVEQLYPREAAFGRRAVELTNERLGVRLPPEEATPIALHLVNAQFSGTDLSRTYRMTEIFAQIFDVISSYYGRPVDQTQLSVARFVTHLRYLFVRAEQGRRPAVADPTLPAIHDAVRTGYPEAYACADKVMLLLNMHLDTTLGEDEHTYLTIHIARLAADMWGEGTARHPDRPAETPPPGDAGTQPAQPPSPKDTP